MGYSYSLKFNKLNRLAEDQAVMYLILENNVQQLENINSNLNGNYVDVKRVISKIIENCNKDTKVLMKMNVVLHDSLKCYRQAEADIMSVDLGKISIDNGSESITDNSGEEESNYILEALLQALLGDFYKGDGNLLGITLSVIIGFIPYAGQIADIRDLISNIKDLIDDGPETKEWVALGFTLVGIIPGLGDLCKHADELGPLLKNADKIADGLGDAIHGVMKKGDEVISAVTNYIDEFKGMFKIVPLDEIQKKVNGFLERELGMTQEIAEQAYEISAEWIKEVTGVDDIKENIVTNIIDGIINDDEETAGKVKTGVFVNGAA